MTFVYLICFLLITVGAVILLRLTPEKITNDLMRFVSPKQTLRDKVLTAKGRKKSRKLTVELNRIKMPSNRQEKVVSLPSPAQLLLF